MYDDMDTLEWEFTGRSHILLLQLCQKIILYILTGHGSKERNLSPPPDELDDALIQEYLSELEEMERWEARQSAMAVPTGAIDIDSEEPSDLERAFAARVFLLSLTSSGTSQ